MNKSVRFLRLFITLLIFLMISGCSESNTQSSTQSVSVKPSEAGATEDDGVYIPTIDKVKVSKPDGVYSRIVFYDINNGENYSVSNAYDEEYGVFRTLIRVTDSETGEIVRDINVEGAEEKYLFIQEVMPLSDDTLLCSAFSNHGEIQDYLLLKVSLDGRITEKKFLSDVVELPKNSYIYSGMASDGTNIYVMVGEKLAVFDLNLRFKKTISKDNVNAFCLGSDGKVYFLAGYNGDLYSYDGKTDKESEKIINIPSANALYTGAENEILVVGQSSLRSVNFNTGEVAKLFKLLDVNIDTTMFDYICRDANGDICIYFSKYKNNKIDDSDDGAESVPYLARIKRYDKDAAPHVEEIKIACLYADSEVKTAVSEYNLAHPATKVTVKLYSDDYSDYDQMKEAFNKDLLDGVPYDIIMFSPDSQVDAYVEKNLIEDLMPYVKNDSSFDVSKYYENILFAEKEGEKLYRITSGAGINGFMGDSETFGDKEALSLDDITGARANHPDIPFMAYGYDSLVLYNMLKNDYRIFLGGESGKYDFRTPEFRKLCEFAATFPRLKDGIDTVSTSEEYLRGGSALLSPEYIVSAEMYLQDRAAYGKNFKIYGAPSFAGNGYFIESSTSYSISSLSTHKEEAWEIIKTFLDAEPDYVGCEFKANKELFKAEIDSLYDLCKEDYGFFLKIGDEVYKLSMSESDCELFGKMIESAVPVVRLDGVISGIIEEEMPVYFSGQKSLDEVIDVMEKRVNLYLEEKK